MREQLTPTALKEYLNKVRSFNSAFIPTYKGRILSEGSKLISLVELKIPAILMHPTQPDRFFPILPEILHSHCLVPKGSIFTASFYSKANSHSGIGGVWLDIDSLQNAKPSDERYMISHSSGIDLEDYKDFFDYKIELTTSDCQTK